MEPAVVRQKFRRRANVIKTNISHSRWPKRLIWSATVFSDHTIIFGGPKDSLIFDWNRLTKFRSPHSHSITHRVWTVWGAWPEYIVVCLGNPFVVNTFQRIDRVHTLRAHITNTICTMWLRIIFFSLQFRGNDKIVWMCVDSLPSEQLCGNRTVPQSSSNAINFSVYHCLVSILYWSRTCFGFRLCHRNLSLMCSVLIIAFSVSATM